MEKSESIFLRVGNRLLEKIFELLVWVCKEDDDEDSGWANSGSK